MLFALKEMPRAKSRSPEPGVEKSSRTLGFPGAPPESNYLRAPTTFVCFPLPDPPSGLRTGRTAEGPIGRPRKGALFCPVKVTSINFEDPEARSSHKVISTI